MSDGTVIIDTKLDNSGIEKGTRNIKKEAAKLAHEYKRAGMSSSDAWKKAWSEIRKENSSGTEKVKRDMNSIAAIARKTAAVLGGIFIIDKIKDYTREIYKAGISYDALSEQALVAWTTILGSHSEAVKMMEKITDYAAETPFSKMGVDTMAKQLANADFKGQALFDQLTKFGDMGSAFGIQEDSLKEMVRQYAQVQQAQVAYTEDLNILQDRGIPIFKALGEVMGVPVSQVKKLASEGKVTADVYNKAIDSIASHTKGAMEGQSQTFNGMMSTLEDNLSVLWGYLAQDWFEGIKGSLSSFLPKFEEFVKLVGTDGLSGAVSKTVPELSPLVDMLSNLGNLLRTVIIPAFLNFGLFISQHIGFIGALAAEVGILVLAFKAATIIMSITKFIKDLKGAMLLLREATFAETVAQYGLNTAILASPITWTIGLILILVAGFIYLWNTSEGFRNFWIGMWNAVKEACISAWNGISHFFTETIPNAFKKVVNFFKEDWKEILLFIVNPFVGAFALAYKHCEGFRNFIDNLVESIKDFFVNGFEYLKNAVSNFGTLLVTKFKNWCDEVWILFTQTIPSWIQSIVDWFSELPHHIGFALGFVVTKLIMWGVDMFNYITTNVPIWIDNITNWFAQLPGRIWTWLVDSINKVKQWGYDMGVKAGQIAAEFLTNTITWFSQLPGRLWTWLTNAINKVKQWGYDMGVKAGQIAAEFLKNTIDYFSKLPGRIWEWLVNTVSKVKAWGVDLWNAGVDSAKQLVKSIIETVESIPGKMVDIGKRIVEGIWQGIINAKNWFMDQVHGFFSGIVDGAKAALGIHSPARKMIPVGDYTVQGMEVGIEKRMPNLQSNMKEKLMDLTRKMKAKVAYESQSLGASIVSRNTTEIINKNNNNDENNPRKFILNIENKNYLDGEELAGHTTQKVIENIGESQDSYTISTGGDFSFA
ncbi:tape measure protein [Clostridium perfringens]|uniref:Tape measure protein n=1 Tax=Clostridium perfringens TaxID=1502 RepID=A0AAW4IVL9_CLOPF|nr:tape measure protein [Clostridium perfringens]MBO3345742.1 tape measure protein [Clostridium perfringens]MBO3348814.1 tape measure protein [Clostridium perfringens]MBO3354715.1 tape measure protein [Clostridium perfringens]MBO3357985.1 tape measure protein [Clostridium perfringens]